jgi:hypothetical protein
LYYLIDVQSVQEHWGILIWHQVPAPSLIVNCNVNNVLQNIALTTINN